ncbi:four-carbon acid sugar kinase family protein [Thermovenabulum gondwanense]|uniref:D-threonate kinase n=1 Tax=Thermovenabulum gondwanense TaxID=520767 RepID=A0A162M7X8_9FIRM|nr:four-carbon acid sugar kinase family protein [Thermovenabulum gondwanense]KYO64489.1 hypothetical protein ATZ99_19170 [Thermovenabulum gondwanense]
MSKIIIIADDFTGANDTGVQLTKKGYKTYTLIDMENFTLKDLECDALVLDTESRGLSSENAYERVKQVIKNLKSVISLKLEGEIIYKKVDSTLRGNIVEEIKAIYEELKPELIVFAPAYPKNNRITLNEIHYVNGIPVDKSEFAEDIKNPVRVSNIKILFKNEGNVFKVRHVYRDEIKNLEKIIKNIEGINTLTFDAENDKDLLEIATQVLKSGKKVLWVGSAGLAEALILSMKKEGKIITISGSTRTVAISQLMNLSEKECIPIINIDLYNLFSNEEEEKNRICSLVNTYYDKDIIITSCMGQQDLDVTKNISLELGIDLKDISQIIAEKISEISLKVINIQKPKGLILTGGDIAFNVVKKLNAKIIKINKEIEPGIPEIELLKGPFKGLKIITKAGGFGNEMTLYNLYKHLKGE